MRYASASALGGITDNELQKESAWRTPGFINYQPLLRLLSLGRTNYVS